MPRHFGFLEASRLGRLFHRPPGVFHRNDGLDHLAVGLGATLYLPATRPALAADITKQTAAGVTSMVVCLEDAIADGAVAEAEENLVDALHTVHVEAGRTGHVEALRTGRAEPTEPALLFVRVRRPEQIPDLCRRLGPAAADLAGFVLPKFTTTTGPGYLQALGEANREAGTALLAMPVLESAEVIHAETRLTELTGLRALLDRHREQVLAVRLGATDLCGLYALRRSRELTIYDVGVVAALVADVVNLLARADGSGFTVTGGVWEYFTGGERIFSPQLRRSPFDEHDAAELRRRLVSRDVDGLIREVELDKANGLTGKTVIHPSHVPVVHALSVVSIEEYRDACDIVGTDPPERPSEFHSGGVIRSGFGNKMNELGPHRAWARRTLLRAEVFGVAADDVSFVDLLAASVP